MRVALGLYSMLWEVVVEGVDGVVVYRVEHSSLEFPISSEHKCAYLLTVSEYMIDHTQILGDSLDD